MSQLFHFLVHHPSLFLDQIIYSCENDLHSLEHTNFYLFTDGSTTNAKFGELAVFINNENLGPIKEFLYHHLLLTSAPYFLLKVLKKFAYHQVVCFLTKSKLLDLFQKGFRKHHNTQSVLIKLTDDISIGIEKKLATLLLQFDFSEAFDNVSPAKLLRKLQAVGFSKSSLHWFWSYLCGLLVW